MPPQLHKQVKSIENVYIQIIYKVRPHANRHGCICLNV